MKYFRTKPTKDIISLNDMRNQKIIDSQAYQDYLRKQLIATKENVTITHLENAFTKEIYYRSMKNLTPLEKAVLFLSAYENKSLGEVCKILKKSKTEVVKLKSQAIKHFKNNVEKYSKILDKKSGVTNE